MDTFNYNRFNREILSPKPVTAIHTLVNALDKKIVLFEEFWLSEKRTSISNSEFLNHFFKNKEGSQHILKYFFKQNCAELIKAIRLNKVFAKRSHFECIQQVFKEDEKFIQEISFWRDCFELKKAMLEEANNSVLLKYNIEQLLLVCGFYYEKERISKSVKRNTDIDLIQIISEIINYKANKLRGTDRSITSFYSEIDFIIEGYKFLENFILSGDNDVAYLFDLFETTIQLEHAYDLYCYQNFSLEIISDREIQLKPNDTLLYLKYKRDGKKYPYWQNFHQNNINLEHGDILEAIENSDMSWYNKLGAINTQCNFLQYIESGFPEIIELDKDKSLPAVSCFQILNSISMWTNIRWNNFVEKAILNNSYKEPYRQILEIIQYNQRELGKTILPICNRRFDDLIRQTEEILHIEHDTSRHGLSILTNNITDASHKVNFLETPFIKIGQNIYWIAGILSNKNYCVTVQNILLRSSNKVRQTYGKETEENLNFWFIKNKFSTILNHKYLDQKGETDLIAFKDGYLFICEAKSTYNRTTIKEISDHRNDNELGINKAITQLNRDIAYIRLYWKQLKNELGTSLDFDMLTIVPLAVTSTLEESEGNIKLDGCNGYIVSYFDLMITLSNKKALLWNLPEMVLQEKYGDNIPSQYLSVLADLEYDKAIANEIGALIESFAINNKEKMDNDLWKEGLGVCSAKDLFNAINDGAVWNFLLNTTQLSNNAISLGDYKINYSC